MKTYRDAAYATAAFSAAAVLFRMLLDKGLISRHEASRALLDEAVSRAIFAETQASAETAAEMNRQAAEILKSLAEEL